MGPSPACTLPPKSTVVGLPGECPTQSSLRKHALQRVPEQGLPQVQGGGLWAGSGVSTSVTDVYITSQVGKVS